MAHEHAQKDVRTQIDIRVVFSFLEFSDISKKSLPLSRRISVRLRPLVGLPTDHVQGVIMSDAAFVPLGIGGASH
jgi:hypothetical protein